jgi:hypothetical protein
MLEVVDDQQRRFAAQADADRLDRDLGDTERAGDGVEHVFRFDDARLSNSSPTTCTCASCFERPVTSALGSGASAREAMTEARVSSNAG